MKSQRLQSLLVALVTTIMAATVAHATDAVSPIGFWKGQDAIFEMFENDGKLSARIVALNEPKTSDGKEKTDIHNPDAAKRDTPIIGLVFIRGFAKKSDTRWEHGTIYNPKSGNTYSCSMDLQGPDKIMVRGAASQISWQYSRIARSSHTQTESQPVHKSMPATN
jgi:uncharacterized protein (DUF2147 family)